jgi:uncharacterized protein
VKENVDLILLCGDLTFAENDLTGIVGPLKKAGKRVLLIPGNHETEASIDFLAKQYSPEVYNLHGRSVMFYNEIGIFGCGGSNIGIFEVTEDETKEALEKAHKPIKDAHFKIMMVHTPPFKTELDTLWAHVGSKAIRKEIERVQPNVCVCGHIHETFGKTHMIGKTKVINVGPEGVILNIEKRV